MITERLFFDSTKMHGKLTPKNKGGERETLSIFKKEKLSAPLNYHAN